MNLIIHAVNVHRGGGRTLLLDMLSALRQPATVLLDERLTGLPAMYDQVRVIRVAPRLMARLAAERLLRKLCTAEDVLLCFGNLPPLFPSCARVFVYLQNYYLVSTRSLSGLPWQARLRILGERLWLRAFLHNAQVLVQTPTMALQAWSTLGRKCRIAPFIPSMTPPEQPMTPANAAPDGSAPPRYDFVYVASGEPHKNHRRLIDAWIILATQYRCYPSLCLTLDPGQDKVLLASVVQKSHQHGLHIVNRPLPSARIADLYSQAGALLYPSLFESFGLPLLEAKGAGIPILAAERDYVRDVVLPTISFDPESPLSIARAVIRYLGITEPLVSPMDATTFIQEILHPEASAHPLASIKSAAE